MSKRKQGKELLINDLKAADQDLDINDVDLVGSDGIRVPAARALLAMWSEYWKKKWFRGYEGVFAEPPTDDEVSHFTSTTLRAVKKYCYTGTIEDFENASSSANTVREMLRLIHAARFYLLPGLQDGTKPKMVSLMLKIPPLACEVLEESTLGGEASEDALAVIRMRSEAALLPSDEAHGKGALTLTELSLQSIIKDPVGDGIDNSVLFRAIVKWHEVDKENRRDDATMLVSDMRLDLIPPSDMSKCVRGSGLVTNEQCLDAYETWSLRAENLMQENSSDFSWKLLSLSLRVDWPHLIIEGAGVAEANESYFPMEQGKGVVHHASCIYAKYDLWMGSMTIFNVLLQKKRWVISGHRAADSDDPKESKVACYKSDPIENENDPRIPKDAWSVQSAGEAPAPKVLYVDKRADANNIRHTIVPPFRHFIC